MYKVKIPKILFLGLDIARFYRKNFFNTNDLAILSNRYKSDLVRLRVDKKDYKYLDDTRSGGLRGNFSTLLTWQGLVKRDSSIVSYYSIGRDNRLANAIHNGQILLNSSDLTASTNDEKLKNLLETEAWLFTVRETQAHVKIMLKNNPSLPLTRDSDNFPKQAIFKSNTDQYFSRSLVNNFVGADNNILQFSIINLWKGNKFKLKNIHPLLVIPTKENSWSEIYAVKNEDLFAHKPLFLNVDLRTKKCFDADGNEYKLYSFSEALNSFSGGDENVENRLGFSWDDLKSRDCGKEANREIKKEDEFSNFLKLFLDWNHHFFIDDREIVDVKVISSGGPDVELIFAGGTKQMLELEHNWNNYLNHKHQNNNAFKNVWIFADEVLNKEKILKLFHDQKIANGDRIPDVYLGLDENKVRKAYRVNWQEGTFTEMQLKFLKIG